MTCWLLEIAYGFDQDSVTFLPFYTRFSLQLGEGSGDFVCRLDMCVCGGMQLSGFLCLTQFDFARFFWVSGGMNLGAVDMFERGRESCFGGW